MAGSHKTPTASSMLSKPDLSLAPHTAAPGRPPPGPVGTRTRRPHSMLESPVLLPLLGVSPLPACSHFWVHLHGVCCTVVHLNLRRCPIPQVEPSPSTSMLTYPLPVEHSTSELPSLAVLDALPSSPAADGSTPVPWQYYVINAPSRNRQVRSLAVRCGCAQEPLAPRPLVAAPPPGAVPVRRGMPALRAHERCQPRCVIDSSFPTRRRWPRRWLQRPASPMKR